MGAAWLHPIGIFCRAGVWVWAWLWRDGSITYSLPPGWVYVGRPDVSVDYRLIDRSVVVDHVALAIGVVSARRLRPNRIAGSVQTECIVQRRRCAWRPIRLTGMRLHNFVQLRVSQTVDAIGHDIPDYIGFHRLPCRVYGCNFKRTFLRQSCYEHLERPSKLLRCCQSIHFKPPPAAY